MGVLDRALLGLILRPVLLNRNHAKLTRMITTIRFMTHEKMNLSAAVAEIIHPDDFPPTRFVEVSEKHTDDGAPEVTDVEEFGDVRGGLLDDRLVSFARGVGPVLGPPRLVRCVLA